MNKIITPITLPGQGVKRKINCPIIQSPLAGVTDQTFRQLVRKWAPEALLFTEMVNATSLRLGFGEIKIEMKNNAVSIAFGALWGFIAGTILKLCISFYMIYFLFFS